MTAGFDRFKQTIKKLGSNAESDALNQRRVFRNFPQIERKNDIIVYNEPYKMEFVLSDHPHSVRLNVYLKPPDGCFKCNQGPAVGFEAATAYYTGGFAQDGNSHPAIYTSFSSNIGGYTLDPAGGIIVPRAGIYNVQFTSGSSFVVTQEIDAVIAAVKHNGVVVAQKIWSVSNGLLPGTLGYGSVDINIWGLCIQARQGDVLGGSIAATSGLAFWSPYASSPTTVTLVALA